MARKNPKVSDVKWTKVSTGGFAKFEKKGDNVIGEYKGRKKITGQFGKQEVFLIETDSGETRVGGSVLTSLFEDIKIGTKVKVIFTGQIGGKGKNKYKIFELYKGE